MARMKFLCDAERCIECNGCVTACKQENEVPWGVNRRRVVTINDGVPGEKSISVACMHCSDAPCMAVCPTDVFYRTEQGVVLHDKALCIGCGRRADAARVSDVCGERVVKGGKGSEVWGWGTAYGKPDNPKAQPPQGGKS